MLTARKCDCGLPRHARPAQPWGSGHWGKTAPPSCPDLPDSSFDTAAMSVDDAVGDGEAQAGSLTERLISGEEWVVHSFPHFVRHPDARIRNSYDPVRTAMSQINCDSASPWKRVDCVQEDVRDALANRRVIPTRPPAGRGWLRLSSSGQLGEPHRGKDVGADNVRG